MKRLQKLSSKFKNKRLCYTNLATSGTILLLLATSGSILLLLLILKSSNPSTQNSCFDEITRTVTPTSLALNILYIGGIITCIVMLVNGLIGLVKYSDTKNKESAFLGVSSLAYSLILALSFPIFSVSRVVAKALRALESADKSEIVRIYNELEIHTSKIQNIDIIIKLLVIVSLLVFLFNAVYLLYSKKAIKIKALDRLFQS